jgi:hypothetical protein
MRRKEAGFIAAQAAIFVAVIALVALPLQSTTEQQTSTYSNASGVSPEGLQLKMALNSSTIQSHGAISARVELVNTLNRNVSASLPLWSQASFATQTIYVWSGYDQICNYNPSDYVVDFAVFQGHFSAGNISAAGNPLRLAPPFFPPCPGQSHPNAVTLLPDGDLTNYTDINYTLPPPRPSYTVEAEVNATTYYCTGSGLGGGGGEIDCGNTTGLVGYWNGSTASPGGDFSYTSHAFTYFPPGEYTIVATDPWNQYVYATFVVQSPIVSSTSSTTTVDPTDGFPRNAAGGWM